MGEKWKCSAAMLYEKDHTNQHERMTSYFSSNICDQTLKVINNH